MKEVGGTTKFLEGFYFWIILEEEQQLEISIKGIPMVTLLTNINVTDCLEDEGISQQHW